jgi:topoisomerase-4 subunit A
MLLFPIACLPVLSKGKGNKIIGIPSSRAAKREEYVIYLVVLNETDKLIITAGKRNLTLNFSDLASYQGERGRRGNKLPRGSQKVDAVRVG